MATHSAMATEKTKTAHRTYAPCGEVRETTVKGGQYVTTGPVMVPSGKRPSCPVCREFGSFEATL